MARVQQRTPPLIGTPRSLATLKRAAPETPVTDHLTQCAQPAPTAPCLLPGCPEQCDWTASPGRPRLFCSRSCQESYKRDASRLREEIDLLEQELTDPDEDLDIGVVRSHLARRRWHLRRYGSAQTNNIQGGEYGTYIE